MPSPILIHWSGPHPESEIPTFNKAHDYGIYMIVGYHITNGPETVLYIGKAQDQKFATRLGQHGWLSKESMPVSVYFGRICRQKEAPILSKQEEEQFWSEAISEAERLLIFSMSPHYNSSNIYWASFEQQVVVYNLGRRHRLAPVLDSEFWHIQNQTFGPDDENKYKYLSE